jgi:hypothetical protein
MKNRWLLGTAILWLASAGFNSRSAAAQPPATGGIEFVARVTPAGGRAEPVREISFYLLRRSLADIRVEAERSEPPAEMDHFIDGLEVSPALKAWMKKHQRVDLVGTDFTKLLTGDDITDVPEFLDAYKAQNDAAHGGAFPEPAFKEKELKTKPEKYKREHDQYIEALHRYVAANPDTLNGLDAEFIDKNPGPRWAQAQADQRRRTEHRTLELAQTSYLAAKTDSDLNGQGALSGLAPGTYWITTLDTPALGGEVRLQWDLAVTVRAGETTRVELSNVNALDPTNRPAH